MGSDPLFLPVLGGGISWLFWTEWRGEDVGDMCAQEDKEDGENTPQ